MSNLKYWDADGPTCTDVYLEEIDYFSARGLRRVYGRGDIFPCAWGSTEMQMSIWRDRNRKMFVRFWSDDEDIDWRAYIIIGMLDTDIIDDHGLGNWIPYCLRSAYAEWIEDELWS